MGGVRRDGRVDGGRRCARGGGGRSAGRVQDRAAVRAVAAVLLRGLLEHVHARRVQQRLGRASAAGRDRQGRDAVRRLREREGGARHAASPIDYRPPQAYYEFLKQSVEWFRTASYGRFNLEITPIFKWYRMPRDSTDWRMDYRSSDPLRRLSADGQGEFTAAAVAAADAEVDFSPYDLIYTVPARNQTAIASSPELNNYTHQIVADGNDLGNGDNFGSDMFSWGYKLLNHETGHAVSLTEGYNAGTGGTFRYMGQWDMMGNISGNAPDYIAWNKWKIGWLNDDEVDCVASDGVTEHTLSANALTPDGTSKKLVAIRTGQNTTLVAELRAPLGVDSIAGGNTARYCESGGILLYTVDSHAAQRPRRLQGARRDARLHDLGLQRRDVDLDDGPRPGPRAEPLRGARARRHVRPHRHQRRRHPRDPEGHPPGHEDHGRARLRRRAVHDDADRRPAQRARRRDLRLGLRRRHDRHRRDRPAHVRHPGPLHGQADRQRRHDDPDRRRQRAVHRHAHAVRPGHRGRRQHGDASPPTPRTRRSRSGGRTRSSSARRATPRRSRRPTRSRPA